MKLNNSVEEYNRPDEDISLLLNHDEVRTGTLMFAHERVRDKMEEDIR